MRVTVLELTLKPDVEGSRRLSSDIPEVGRLDTSALQAISGKPEVALLGWLLIYRGYWGNDIFAGMIRVALPENNK